MKYWGKHGRQLPENPNISFTLSEANTKTTIICHDGRPTGAPLVRSFIFEGQENLAFGGKLEKLLLTVTDILPWLNDVHLEISSTNSFPHSAGIASSASGMGAVALCLCDIEMQRKGQTASANDEGFLRKASMLSRLLSGSACRSMFPYMGAWGKGNSIAESNDEYAVPFTPHEIFKTHHDDILIISALEKKVSSTAGHGLMKGNDYASPRYKQANERLAVLTKALQDGDVETVGRITEEEALTLHALMMTSTPPYILMEPDSLKAIRLVQEFRADTGLPLYFSLDAGPNLHLLYPNSIEKEAFSFIDSQLRPLCSEGRILRDRVGKGACLIDN